MSQASVITLSVLLLVGLVAAVTIGILNYVANNDNRPATSAKAVQEMCQPTDYKEACFKSLGKVNSDDPKELVKAAFESTKDQISEVANKSTLLKELEKDPKTAQAVQDCKELFQDATDDLQRSFEQIGGFEFNQVNTVLENIKVWLSATMTYQETCLDGFDNTTGDAGDKVRKLLQTSMQMSSNGLAIVNEMSNLLGTLDISSFNRRRLLAHDRVRNRRLLGSDDTTLLEDDEPDRRRRRLLSSVNRVEGHYNDDDILPVWLDSGRRKLLEATNLAEDLKAKANVVVAQDGSGKHKTIEAALAEIPKYGNESFIIYIKEGVYNEYLVVYKWHTHVVFVGDGPTKTKITNNKNFADGVKTFKTATLSVLGDFFMAKDIGVENSAGAIKHQAVALRVQSDQSIFYNCQFDGYQDTLYTHTYRQYYRDCKVTGTIDFIFGDAAAFFQNCTFVVRKPLENQRCIVTAQGRMERHQPTGIIIHKSRFEADPDYYPVRKTNTAYLGRPWKEYSKTIIMESHIDDLIAPEGWLPWEGNFALETCYYGEYNNVGPGSDMSNRVKWRGIKIIGYARAERFMPPQLYENDEWIKASGAPYDPTLDALAPGPGFGFDEDPNAPQGSPTAFASMFPGFSSGSSSTPSTGGQSTPSSSGGQSSSGVQSTSSSSSSSSSSSGSSSSSSSSGGSSSSSSGGSSTSSSGGSSSSGSTPSTGSSSSSTPQENSSNGASSTSNTNEGGSTTTSSSTTPSTSGSSSQPGSNGAPGKQGSTTEQGQSGSTTEQGSGSNGSSSAAVAATDTATTPSAPADETSSSPAISEAPAPAESPAVTPSATPVVTPEYAPQKDTLVVSSPTTSTTPTEVISKGSSPSTSPSSSPSSATEVKRKLTGPVTIHELERMLMTNEEMEGEDEAANDDMSGNVPDGDEPSPAMVQPSPASAPSPAPSPSPSLAPIISPSESPISSPGPSPSEEVSDWLPPATAPEPDVEPADKVPPTPSKKTNNAISNSKVTKLYVILSGVVMWVALAM